MIEEWRAFLKEQQNQLPQIYCDMDGVLVDFEQGVVNQINVDLLDDSISSRKPTGGITKMGRLRRVLKLSDRELEISLPDIRRPNDIRAARNYMYDRVGDNVKFWTELPSMKGGMKLWQFISPYQPYILTSPMQEGSQIGKRNWLKKNLNPQPSKVYMSHDKWKWATTDGRPNILIDDWDKNLVPWEENGGIAIRCAFGDSDSAIRQLKEFGFHSN
jgi:5'(3')-deoxyribonucleotidase